jgi:hypothetical protein
VYHLPKKIKRLSLTLTDFYSYAVVDVLPEDTLAKITYITSIREFTTIYALMNFQIALLPEQFITHFTDMTPLCVCLSSDGSVD